MKNIEISIELASELIEVIEDLKKLHKLKKALNKESSSKDKNEFMSMLDTALKHALLINERLFSYAVFYNNFKLAVRKAELEKKDYLRKEDTKIFVSEAINRMKEASIKKCKLDL